MGNNKASKGCTGGRSKKPVEKRDEHDLARLAKAEAKRARKAAKLAANPS